MQLFCHPLQWVRDLMSEQDHRRSDNIILQQLSQILNDWRSMLKFQVLSFWTQLPDEDMLYCGKTFCPLPFGFLSPRHSFLPHSWLLSHTQEFPNTIIFSCFSLAVLILIVSFGLPVSVLGYGSGLKAFGTAFPGKFCLEFQSCHVVLEKECSF